MISLFDDYLEECMQKAKNDSTILESMNGWCYEVLTESSIKDKAIQIGKFIIKLLKDLLTRLKNLVKAVVNKFKAAFKKDEVLLNKVNEAEKKPLLLSDNVIKVRFRHFDKYTADGILRIGMTPIRLDTIQVMKGMNICDENYKLIVSVDELRKFMLHKRLFNTTTSIDYSANSIQDFVQYVFWQDKSYKDYTINELGGIEDIRRQYEYCKKQIDELSNTNVIDNDIKYEINDVEESIEEYKNEYNETQDEKKRIKYQRILNKLKLQQYCLNIFAGMANEYVEALLSCYEEAYKMCKVALIKIAGSANNFSEAQIDRVTRLAMIETEICFI